jgi:hypothetical protein
MVQKSAWQEGSHQEWPHTTAKWDRKVHTKAFKTPSTGLGCPSHQLLQSGRYREVSLMAELACLHHTAVPAATWHQLCDCVFPDAATARLQAYEEGHSLGLCSLWPSSAEVCSRESVSSDEWTPNQKDPAFLFGFDQCTRTWSDGKGSSQMALLGVGEQLSRETNHLEAAPCHHQTRPPSGLSCRRCWWCPSRDTGCSLVCVALGRLEEAGCWGERSCCPEPSGLLPLHCFPGPRWRGRLLPHLETPGTQHIINSFLGLSTYFNSQKY